MVHIPATIRKLVIVINLILSYQKITLTTEKVNYPCSPHTIRLGDEEHNEDENSHVEVTLT